MAISASTVVRIAIRRMQRPLPGLSRLANREDRMSAMGGKRTLDHPLFLSDLTAEEIRIVRPGLGELPILELEGCLIRVLPPRLE